MAIKQGKADLSRFGVDGRHLKVTRGTRRVELSVLKADARDELSDSDFALSGRKYPIHDLEHARNALSRVAQSGTPDEQRKVRAAVARKYGNRIKAFRKAHHNISTEEQKDQRPDDEATELSHGDHDSSTHPDLLNKPGKTNWVEEQGGLPSFIKRVAKHIVADGGLSESHAIAAAVQQCRDGKFGAKGLAAYAEFRAKAAAARATR